MLVIFITITQELEPDDKVTLFLCNNTYILNYIELIKLYKQDSTIFSLLIAFFSYLIRESKDIQLLFFKLEIVHEIYNSFSIETNSNEEVDAKIYFFSSIDNGEIYKQNPQITIKFEKAFRETTFYYSSNNLFDENLSTINNCLWGLANITISSDEEFLHQLFSNSILEYFLDLNIQREQFVIPKIRLIGNLLGTSDFAIIKKMIELGCVEFITETILNKKQCIIEEALWALGNIIVDENLIDYIFDKHLDSFLLDLIESNNIDEGCIREIICSFGGLIEHLDSSQYYKLKNIRLCKTLVYQLQYCKDEKLIYFILHFIHLLFKKDKERVFIIPFNNLGGSDLIERISSLYIIEEIQVICNKIQVLIAGE